MMEAAATAESRTNFSSYYHARDACNRFTNTRARAHERELLTDRLRDKEYMRTGFELYNDNRILVRREDTETYIDLFPVKISTTTMHTHRSTERHTLRPLTKVAPAVYPHTKPRAHDPPHRSSARIIILNNIRPLLYPTDISPS